MTRTILALCLLTAGAQAQTPPVPVLPCMPLKALKALDQALADKHSERPAVSGIVLGGSARLVLWANTDTGTWTAAVVQPDGSACLVAAGSGWETMRTAAEGQGS